MARDGEQFVTGFEFFGSGSFQNEVFFVLQDGFCIGQIGEGQSLPGRRVRRDSFVADVERDSCWSWSTDDPSQHHGCWRKYHIRKPAAVSGVVVDARAGAVLDARVCLFGIDRE